MSDGPTDAENQARIIELLERLISVNTYTNELLEPIYGFVRKAQAAQDAHENAMASMAEIRKSQGF